MRIAFFRAKATRRGPLPIDRIPKYIDHGTPHTNLLKCGKSMTGVFKAQTKHVQQW
jgi:hypothetical protein